MLRLYPNVNRIKDRAYFYIRKFKNGKMEDELLRIGECVIVEGGPSTGKTSFLNKAVKQLEEAGEKCISINATMPLGEWVKDYKLFGKSLEKRVDFFLSSLPEKYYLIIDNAERLNDSRKLEILLYLFERARSVILGCTRQGLLHPKLKVRLSNVKVHNLGSGADTFDITYFMVAIIIVFVAVIGAYNLIFLAAAMRYMFQGTRMGGRRV